MGLRRWLPLLVLAVAPAAAAPAAADDAASWLGGDVVAVRGRWTAGGSRIVSDARLRTAGGAEVVVSQLGGHVDGITMAVLDGPPALTPGQRVRIEVHPATVDGAEVWLAGSVVLEGGAAGPSVRGHSVSGAPFHWAKSCVLITAAAEGTTAVTDEAGALAAARASWNDGTAACSYLDLVDGGTAADRDVGFDGVNLIKYRDTRWCRPASGGDPERCHDPGAIALTTIFFVDSAGHPRDGEILDGDVELNNVDFRLTVGGQGTGTAACDADIAAILTHELGHVLGLEHVCHGGGEPPAVDHNGDPVPLCGGIVDPTITEATMFPYQDCGETKQLTVEPDDVGGLCGAYPTAADPGVCGPPDPASGGSDAGSDAAMVESPGEGSGCCGASTHGGGAAGVLAFLVLAPLARRRRETAVTSPSRPCEPRGPP